MKQGDKIRVRKGVHAGKVGTIIINNGSYCKVVFHGEGEAVVRVVGRKGEYLARDSSLYLPSSVNINIELLEEK